jgi:hypothetical protein
MVLFLSQSVHMQQSMSLPWLYNDFRRTDPGRVCSLVSKACIKLQLFGLRSAHWDPKLPSMSIGLLILEGSSCEDYLVLVPWLNSAVRPVAIEAYLWNCESRRQSVGLLGQVSTARTNTNTINTEKVYSYFNWASSDFSIRSANSVNWPLP